MSVANVKRPQVAAGGHAVLQPRIEYLPMRPDDIPAVAALARRIAAFPWTGGNFADSLAAGHVAWVCREDGELAGYAVMLPVLDEAHLLDIGVAGERQRRGLGSALLEFVVDLAKSAGARRLFLEVRPSNEAGRALYRRYGFAEIGRRRGYYPAAVGREDALVMARDL